MKSLNIIFIITLILILMGFSSEISFMPNYVSHGDTWHILYPTLMFYFILSIETIWCLGLMIKHKKIFWIRGVKHITALLLFAFLSLPSSPEQIFGYVGLGLLLIATTSILYFKKQKPLIN